MTRIAVMDSGLGGLSVLAEVRRLLPDAALSYLADSAAFPYGALSEQGVRDRVRAVANALLARDPADVLVIACNTASTAALDGVRADHPDLPVVGVVPAIKPAAHLSETGVIGLLATPGTVNRAYVDDLIARHAADCTVLRHGAPTLAGLAEAALRGAPPAVEEVRAEIAPLFTDRRLDVVVLGCTHYPLIVELLKAAAPWPVEWMDSGMAIARRVRDVTPPGPGSDGPDHSWVTAQVPGLDDAFAAFGLPPGKRLAV